jgi:hypothetical protein
MSAQTSIGLCLALQIMSHEQQGMTIDFGGWLRGLGLGQYESTDEPHEPVAKESQLDLFT